MLSPVCSVFVLLLGQVAAESDGSFQPPPPVVDTSESGPVLGAPVNVDDEPPTNGLRSFGVGSEERRPAFRSTETHPRNDVGSVPGRRSSSRTAPNRIATEGMTSVQGRLESEVANSLVQAALDIPDDGRLPGRYVSLQEILAPVVDTHHRTAVAKGYWKLSDAIMRYHFACDGARLLASIPDSNQAIDAPQIVAARTDAVAAESEARQAVIEAQFALAETAGLELADPPLPADAPLVSAYRTRLAEIYPNESAPREFRRIDRLLPALFETIHQRGESTAAAIQAVDALQRGHADGQVPTAVMLDGLANLQKQRNAFLVAVHRYNDMIADYAIPAVGGRVSSDQAVAMLIGRGRVSGTGTERGVQPATANVPLGDAADRRIRR